MPAEPSVIAVATAARRRHGPGIAAVLFYGSCMRRGDDVGGRRRSVSAGGQLPDPPWPADAHSQLAVAAECLLHRGAVRGPDRAREICAAHPGAVRAVGRTQNAAVLFLGTLCTADSRALGARAGRAGTGDAGACHRCGDHGAGDAAAARPRRRPEVPCGRAHSTRRTAPSCAPRRRNGASRCTRRLPSATTRSRGSCSAGRRPAGRRARSTAAGGTEVVAAAGRGQDALGAAPDQVGVHFRGRRQLSGVEDRAPLRRELRADALAEAPPDPGVGDAVLADLSRWRRFADALLTRGGERPFSGRRH